MKSVASFGKKMLLSHPLVLTLFSKISKIFGFNKFSQKGRNNKLIYEKSFIWKTKINIIGSNNTVVLGKMCRLRYSSIYIHGDNNKISIGNKAYLNDAEFHIEDNDNEICIGDNTTVFGKTHFACIESKKIRIGNDCMFSSDVVFRTGDSHSIIDNAGKRINESKDIIIGDHVWFGNKTIVTKGVSIADNSIVGTGAVVTKLFLQSGIAIAGNPARIIKENVNWVRERI